MRNTKQHRSKYLKETYARKEKEITARGSNLIVHTFSALCI